MKFCNDKQFVSKAIMFRYICLALSLTEFAIVLYGPLYDESVKTIIRTILDYLNANRTLLLSIVLFLIITEIVIIAYIKHTEKISISMAHKDYSKLSISYLISGTIYLLLVTTYLAQA